MAKGIRISLANKCQLLFGLAVVLILTAALAVVWQRLNALTVLQPLEEARDLADAWVQAGPEDDLGEAGPVVVRRIDADTAIQGPTDTWIQASARQLRDDAGLEDAYDTILTPERQRRFRYLRPLFAEAGEPPTAYLLIELDDDASRQAVVNRIYLVAAGLVAGLLATAVFWFITTRLVLSPVRTLRQYAQKVSKGDLNIRSDVNTGDEFEQLSDMFNTMLDNLKRNQDELHSANKSLDLKLDELAESNVALYEANRVKGDFLANVSHELRTPLNSIIGFAEILQETLKDREGPVDEKRKRYAANIIGSSQRLLDLINDLLDLAKIEAGRMSVNISSVSAADTCEGLLNLMRPEASKRNIALKLRVEPNLPLLQTDAGKLQQVLFNFLSNAVKFTPERGSVTLATTLIPPRDAESPPEVRFSVTDTGPGISRDDQALVFEKFNQLDPSVTREHGGTGLGLTISQELADMLQGRIDLESEPGHGATFSLTIPIAPKARTSRLMTEETANGA